MRSTVVSLSLLAFGTVGWGDDSPNIDPLALQVLRAVCDSVKKSDQFSFRAIVAKERLGTNGQIITTFNDQHIAVDGPDKIRVDYKSAFADVTLYYNDGNAVLYAPAEKLYATLDAGKSIDQVLDNLDKRDIQVPMAPILRSDPYPMLIDGLKSAAVIGRSEVAGKIYHHLAFTESDTEWQVWVEAGDRPTPRRLEIVYKDLPREPRVTVDFLEWNLNANLSPDSFTFHKPQDAKQIEFIKVRVKEGGD